MNGIEVKVYYASTDELIGEFDTIDAASYEYEVSAKAIKNSILGKTKSIKGLYFRSDDLVNVPKNHYEVKMYEADTNRLLHTFSSLAEASRVTGYPASVIWKNLTGYQKTVDKRQYIFRSEGVEYKPKHPEPYIQKGQSKNWLKKAVDVYSVEEDELLGTFESVTAAANFIGCKSSAVTVNCKSRLKYKHQGTIYKKYYCKYHNE